MENIDTLEQDVLETLKYVRENPETDALVDRIQDCGGLDNFKKISAFFSNVNGNVQRISELHEFTEKVKIVYDAKGDQTAPEILRFVEQVGSLSADDYNDPVAFMAKTFLKGRVICNANQEQNPFNPS